MAKDKSAVTISVTSSRTSTQNGVSVAPSQKTEVIVHFNKDKGDYEKETVNLQP